MDNVIQVDFSSDDEGYILEDGEVKGVYQEILGAYVYEKNSVAIGRRTSDGIDNAQIMSLDEMNRFCLMWLSIFDESVIAKEPEQLDDHNE